MDSGEAEPPERTLPAPDLPDAHVDIVSGAHRMLEAGILLAGESMFRLDMGQIRERRKIDNLDIRHDNDLFGVGRRSGGQFKRLRRA